MTPHIWNRISRPRRAQQEVSLAMRQSASLGKPAGPHREPDADLQPRLCKGDEFGPTGPGALMQAGTNKDGGAAALRYSADRTPLPGIRRNIGIMRPSAPEGEEGSPLNTSSAGCIHRDIGSRGPSEKCNRSMRLGGTVPSQGLRVHGLVVRTS